MATEQAHTATKNGTTTAPSTGHIFVLPFASIVRDESFNVRGVYKGIDELADSIKSDGLLNPLTIRQDEKGNYHLVSGFRRSRAIEVLLKRVQTGEAKNTGKLDVEYVRVELKTYAEDGDASIANLTENTGRDEIRSCDLARRLAEMHKQGLKTSKIAKRTTLSESHINNLVAAWNTLRPEIIQAWTATEAQVDIPMSKLFAWKKLSEDEQLIAFNDFMGIAPEGAEGDAEGGSQTDGDTTPSPAKAPTKTEIKAKLDALDEKTKGGKKLSEMEQGIRRALRWVLADLKTL